MVTDTAARELTHREVLGIFAGLMVAMFLGGVFVLRDDELSDEPVVIAQESLPT